MATPSVTLSRDKAPLGSPIDITYKFVVAPRREVHAELPRHGPRRRSERRVDVDGRSRSADRRPPQWKPGQTVEYTRTVFVPVYPYVGRSHDPARAVFESDEPRLPLSGDDAGQRAYKVGRVQLAPQSENVFTVFKDGWHPAESAEHNAMVEWHWTKKSATLAVQESQEGQSCFTWNWTTPAASSRSRSRSR